MGNWVLFLTYLLVAIAYIDAICPTDYPDRNLLCYQNKFTEDELDPCLCTHWVLTRELLDEKDYLLERNEDLQIILSVETGETNLTQEIYAENVQGIELSTPWKKEPRLLVKYVKSIVDELYNSPRSKRSYSVNEDDLERGSTLDDEHITETDSEEETASSDAVTKAGVTSAITADPLEEEQQDVSARKARELEDRPTLIMHLPSNSMILAKHYDLKGLSRYVDLFVLNSDNIVESRKNVTYHPSRLMGINDIHNADSLVDLVTGLGIPREKLVLAFPSNAYQFQLSNQMQSLPQSPSIGGPKIITQTQLCKLRKTGNWTVERDEDLTAPYAFKNETWIAFDDEMSASIKSKYIALSNLAGAAIMNVEDQDWTNKCSDKGPTILKAVFETFTVVTRKPRQTQLLELEQQLHEHSMDSPTRVARVVDHEGSVHVVRRDVKINFECSRQGYFVHPTGCNRFYRCVKFNQYTDDFTVFEYDCPAGLAFDERWEVCVWPGSLPDGGACQGSSEIAPVPRNRFQCPQQPGYYADPENCRWFFACLDHVGDGVTPLTAYEFRCPFSLVFNEQTLVCDWPWNVQGCGKQGVGGARFTYGDLLEGRLKPSYATVPDYLVSGGRIESPNAGSILGTYYGSNGVLDINGAGNYASESQQSYGSKSLHPGAAGAGLSASSGQYPGSSLYSNSKGQYSAGSGKYPGNSLYTAGNGQYSVYGKPGVHGGSYSTGSNQYGQYIKSGEGAYVHGQYPGDSGDDGSYREGKYDTGGGYVGTGESGLYSGGKYGNGGKYVANGESELYSGGKYGNGGKYVANGESELYSGGKYENSGGYIATGDSGLYSGGKYDNGGRYVATGESGSYSGGKYSGSLSGSGKYVGEHLSGSDQSGNYVSGGEYSGIGAGKYYGAASAYNRQGQYSGTSASGNLNGIKYSSQYSGETGEYDTGKYSPGSQYVENGEYSANSGAYVPGTSGQYIKGGFSSSVPGGYSVSSTPVPFLSTQSGQYTLSNGLQYTGPSIKSGVASTKSNIYSTPSSIGTTTVTPQYISSQFGLVSSTTPSYSTTSRPGDSLYSGVSLGGERFGVNGESGHIAPLSNKGAYTGFENSNYNGLAFQVNSLQPSLSENVYENGYSTSGKVFFSPTPTSGGFSSYSPGSYSTPAPTTYYSSTSLPASFSPIAPIKSIYGSSTPSPLQYNVHSSIPSNSYSTPSSLPAVSTYTSNPSVHKVSYSTTPAPYSPSSSSYSLSSGPVSFVPYSSGPKQYTPSTVSPVPASYSTPAPPAFVSYSRPASPKYSSYSTPAPPAFASYSTPAPPAFASYSTPAPPAFASYSTPAPPAFASYSTPAPPAFASYSSSSPAKYASYPTPAPPAYASYSTPAPPAFASYSTPAPPAFASYSTPDPPAFASYSTPAPPEFASYSTPAPPAFASHSTPAPPAFGSYSTPAPPAFASYSSSSPAKYASYTTPAPPAFASYSTPAPPAFASYSSSASGKHASYSTPAPPAFASYSTPAPPAFVSYSSSAPAKFASYSTPAPPAFASYSTPAPPAFASYSTPAPPAFASYSSSVPAKFASYRTPAPPAFASYSTPAPPAFASYSSSVPAKFASYPTPAPPAFASYPTPAPPAFVSYSTPAPPTFASYSTPAPPALPSYSTAKPAIVSYSSPAPKTYYPTSTPIPLVQYSSVAPQVYKSSAEYSSYSGNVPVGSFPSYPQSYSSYQAGQYAGLGDLSNNAKPYFGPINSESYYSSSHDYSKSDSYPQNIPALHSSSYRGSVHYSTSSPLAYDKTASPSSTYAPVAYSTTLSPSGAFKYPTPKPISYEASKSSYEFSYPSQSFSGEEYLPPLESAPAYGVKKPCTHSAKHVPPQPYVGTSYESINYQAPYVPPSPSFTSDSLLVKPIVVQSLPEVSSFKDYFYSSVLPSSPAPIVYSTTPAYYSSSVRPVEYSSPIYSTPLKSYVPSTTIAPLEYNYVSSYSTPKPVSYSPSTTAAPIIDTSYVSSYSTPKPISYSTPIVSSTPAPIVDYSFVSSYSPKPIVYSTTAAPAVDYSFASTYSPKPISYSTPAPVSYATFESSKIFKSTTAEPIAPYPTSSVPLSGPLSYSSYSVPPVVYGPNNLQPIKSYQSTGSYDIQSYTATPKPCASANSLDIANPADTAHLSDGTYVVGVKKQDKVVIVSRLSDFNPLLVEKLGATCDCHSQSQPIKILRRRKVKSTTASYDADNSGKYNSNSIQSYNAYKVDSNSNTSPNVDIVSYNTQEEAERAESFHASKAHKKLSAKKTSPAYSTTEKSYETSDEHSHGEETLSITEFGTIECKRAGLFRHPKHCNKFYQCNWDQWKKKFTLHEFKCPIHLAYDNNIGACNWPSKGPACSNDNLLV